MTQRIRSHNRFSLDATILVKADKIKFCLIFYKREMNNVIFILNGIASSFKGTERLQKSLKDCKDFKTTNAKQENIQMHVLTYPLCSLVKWIVLQMQNMSYSHQNGILL